MPNLDPWINQSESDQQQRISKAAAEISKLENHLPSVRVYNQKQIKPNCHPTYNADHEKRIELIDWTLKKYKDGLLNKTLQHEEQLVDNIIDELDKKRDLAISKKKKALLKDDMLKYRLEEDALDYVLFVIRDFTGKYYN
jgi:hypothetical protein